MNVNYLLFLSVLALSILLPNAFAENIFLKIDTIAGESTDSDHRDWIDVTSWSLGDSRDESSTGTSSQRDTNPSFDDLIITKQLDKSSPLIFLAAANGQHFSVVFETRSPTSEGAYLIYTLKDVVFTGYEISDSAGDSFPTEIISLSFSEIIVTDSESDTKGGDSTKDTGDAIIDQSPDSYDERILDAGSIIDSDNDGISDEDEINIYGTNPLNPDTDGDEILDGYDFCPNDPTNTCDSVEFTPTDSGESFSFGGTLESAQTFAIMESDGTTSTTGKQGYSFGNKSAGTGLPETNSDKICGLSLCTEKMSTAEIIQQYLQSKGLD